MLSIRLALLETGMVMRLMKEVEKSKRIKGTFVFRGFRKVKS